MNLLQILWTYSCTCLCFLRICMQQSNQKAATQYIQVLLFHNHPHHIGQINFDLFWSIQTAASARFLDQNEFLVVDLKKLCNEEAAFRLNKNVKISKPLLWSPKYLLSSPRRLVPTRISSAHIRHWPVESAREGREIEICERGQVGCSGPAVHRPDKSCLTRRVRSRCHHVGFYDRDIRGKLRMTQVHDVKGRRD